MPNSVPQYTNFDLNNIHTPVKVDVLERMLISSEFNKEDTTYLIKGFREGFDISYAGPLDRQDTSKNLPLSNGIGDEIDLWQKMMKEVKAKRYAGPFLKIPFKNFVQSPIGLVPKAGNQTRQIFHLSYNFGKEERQQSINYFTPKELCSVKYNDFDHAIRSCIKLIKTSGQKCPVLWMGSSDVRSAFRLVPTKPENWPLMVMKARNPESGRMEFFVDKNLPFGSSILCAVFTKFSNSLAHLMRYVLRQDNAAITNYLDDFLFVTTSKQACNRMVRTFLQLCEHLGVPVAMDKTSFADTQVIFLGILIDGERKLIVVPEQKKRKAIQMLNNVLAKKKLTVREVQQLTGTLNFLNKAIVPGRAFTRRMYSKLEGRITGLKQHHHIRIDGEMKADCEIWLQFLSESGQYYSSCCRPFVDLDEVNTAEDIGFYTDATANSSLGCGGIMGRNWYFLKWDALFMRRNKPSIEYLELYGVCVGIFMWKEDLKDMRIRVNCDNKSVVGMLNTTVSSCGNCMILIRKLTLLCLKYNCRVFGQHVKGIHNGISDSLSRMQFKRFRKLTKNRDMNPEPSKIPEALWPMNKVWDIRLKKKSGKKETDIASIN